jgi:hypothetical protein
VADYDICELLPAQKEVMVQGMFFITASIKARTNEETEMYSFNVEKLYMKKPTFV